MIGKMVMELIPISPPVKGMKAIGKTVKKMARVCITMPTVMSIQVKTFRSSGNEK